MRPNVRSASGMVLMLAIIPIFAGLLACMPVPIGDPERSRIDPEITGVWFLESDGTKIGPLGGYVPTETMLEVLTFVQERRYDTTQTDVDSSKQ